MNKLIRSALVASAALVVVAPVSGANAAGNSWTTIETLAKGKQQACRVLVDDGKAWKIKNRLDTRKVTDKGELRATLRVQYKGKDTKQYWSSGYLTKGKVSKVGVIYLPRKANYTLLMTIDGKQFGDGGNPSIRKIGGC